MAHLWAFVGEFRGTAGALAKLKKKLPPRLTALEELRDHPGALRDVVYGKGHVALRRLSNGDEWAEERVRLRELLTDVADCGVSGSGALVAFVDGGPDAIGVAFDVDEGEASERALKTKKAVRAVVESPGYRLLVERYEAAFDEEPAEVSAAVDDVRTTVLKQLGRLTDQALMQAARKSKLKIEVDDKKRGVRLVPLVEVHADATALRKALAAGSKEWGDAINHAPLLLLSQVEPGTALTLARRLADEGMDRFHPLGPAVRSLLGASTLDEDLERLWKLFERTGDGEWELIASPHPAVDERALASLRRELGEPSAWRMPWDDAKHGALVRILWRRDHGPGVRLIEEAGRSHPWKWFFTPSPALRGKRSR